MKGNPKFKLGTKVKFKCNKEEYIGDIFIVDRFGVFEDNTDVHYDIMVEEFNGSNDSCLFKHIREDKVNKI